MSFFDLVYLSMQLEFFDQLPPLCLEDIIDSLARKRKHDDRGNALVIDDDHVCRGRTKRFLLRQVNEFINDLEIADAEVDMKQCVSMTQLNRLIRVFKVRRGRVTSYAMIIFHVLLLEFRKADASFTGVDILEFALAINEIARMFYRQYPENELARFLVESGQVLIDEIEREREADKSEFPGIPRRGCSDEGL